MASFESAGVTLINLNNMKQEIRLFFTALMFYTRIPCPSNIDHNEDALNKATRYFSLIGWIVGGKNFLVLHKFFFYLTNLLQ